MLQACEVSMDSVPGSFKAWHNPAQRWDGWAMPHMSKEQAQVFVDAFNRTAGNMEPDAYYDAEKDAFCFPNQETFEIKVEDGVEYRAGIDLAPAVTIDGRTLYDFAHLGWCWWLD